MEVESQGLALPLGLDGCGESMEGEGVVVLLNPDAGVIHFALLALVLFLDVKALLHMKY